MSLPSLKKKHYALTIYLKIMKTFYMNGKQEERRGKMLYKIKKLKSFDKSAFDADSDLYALSPKAADRYFDDYNPLY